MLQSPLISNNSGFTLTEVMVAILIMMVGMLGLLQAVNMSMEYNLKNHLRDEAVYLGERYMNELRGKPYDFMSTTYTPFPVKSKMRGSGRTYTVERGSQDMAFDNSVTPPQVRSKQLQVTVKWAYRNVTTQNRVVTALPRPPQ